MAKARVYDLDMLGNWDAFTADTDAADPIDFGDDPEVERTHNSANEITKHEFREPGEIAVVSGQPKHDAAGNYRSDWGTSTPGGKRYTYDAWNRLVKVENWATGSTFDIARYEYNGLHWRVAKEADTSKGAHDVIDERRVFYYSPSWQILEEHVDSDLDTDTDRVAQQFWGRRYIDDAIARRVDRDPADDWSLDQEVFYYLTDALFSVRAVTTANGTVRDRIDYTPYGEARHRYVIDIDENGVYNGDDPGKFADSFTSSGIGDPDYDPDADFDGNGAFNGDDAQHFADMWTLYGSDPVLPAGWVSDPADDAGPDSMISFAGYRLNHETEQHEVRHRVLRDGRWMQRDPLGSIEGLNLYAYVRGNAATQVDPLGLVSLKRRILVRAAAVIAVVIVIEEAGFVEYHDLRFDSRNMTPTETACINGLFARYAPCMSPAFRAQAARVQQLIAQGRVSVGQDMGSTDGYTQSTLTGLKSKMWLNGLNLNAACLPNPRPERELLVIKTLLHEASHYDDGTSEAEADALENQLLTDILAQVSSGGCFGNLSCDERERLIKTIKKSKEEGTQAP